jgi:hydroxypyruvate reductase
MTRRPNSIDAKPFSDIFICMKIPAQLFSTHTLLDHPKKTVVQNILASAIQAVEPSNALHKFVRREGNLLLVDHQEYDLSLYRHIYLMAIGKASQAMSQALAEILGQNLTKAYIVPKRIFEIADERFEIIAGGHPLPNENSLLAGRMLAKACQNMGEQDLVFCLISGGGSALVTLPAGDIQLQDMQALTGQLLACGARIDEINTLRRHLDRIKGGGLAQMVSPASLVSLILSDVVNSPLEAIASGPSVPDLSTLEDAIQVLEKYRLTSKTPASILNQLQTGAETAKQDNPLFAKVQNVLIADNFLAAKAAARQAQEAGFNVIQLGNAWQGEARLVAAQLCEILKANPTANTCWIAGGETTVTLQGGGRGGRNQELALAAVNELAGLPQVLLVTLATDGEDGPTDAAGAVVSGETRQRALSAGLDAAAFLQQNDAYHFFERLGDLLKIGPTGTNVNDLTFLFRF